MNLTRYKQETIINFNEAEGSASIYTHNPALKRKLKQLSVERPAECCLEKVSCDGLAEEYSIPKSWVKVNPTQIISQEQRAAMGERARNRLLRRNSQVIDEVQDPNSIAEGNYISQPSNDKKEE